MHYREKCGQAAVAARRCPKPNSSLAGLDRISDSDAAKLSRRFAEATKEWTKKCAGATV
jgi:hypothetical protein